MKDNDKKWKKGALNLDDCLIATNNDLPASYVFKNKTYTHNPRNCYLYFPFSFAMKTGENYAGFGGDGGFGG